LVIGHSPFGFPLSAFAQTAGLQQAAHHLLISDLQSQISDFRFPPKPPACGKRLAVLVIGDW